MQSALIEAHDSQWNDVLSVTRHDLYQLPGYVGFATRWEEPGTAAAFIAEEGGRSFLLPLIVRPIPDDIAGEDGWLDATGPKGYSGPIVGPSGAPVDGAFVERAIARMRVTLDERRIVSAFVRCHPLLTPPLPQSGLASVVVDHSESVSIDLALSAEQVWAETRQNHRREITRALRDGYRVRIDESWQHLEGFLALYSATMERIGAAAHWRLSHEYVTDLRSTAGARVHLCVVELDGTLAAAALLTEVDGIVEYHLASTSLEHVAASPTKLLIEQASRWARERGDRVFHLAGSLRRDDPLIHFKRGFSPLRHQAQTWHVVSDPATYDRLVARRDLVDGPGDAPTEGTAEYFPAYRRPAASGSSGEAAAPG